MIEKKNVETRATISGIERKIEGACGDMAQNAGCDDTCPPCVFKPKADELTMGNKIDIILNEAYRRRLSKGEIGNLKFEIDGLLEQCQNKTMDMIQLNERCSAVVEAAGEYLKEHSCSNSQGTCQDETNLRKALADLVARKG